ncbi:MAG: MaoC/PaaZ C-terminal domain-containing protein, partial [Gaiellaceae bacterium]
MSAAGPGTSAEPVEGATIVSNGRTVTETDLVIFAGLTGDYNPQHTDAVWSTSSPFGERVAHGMLVISYAIGLMPIEVGRVVALRRLDK